MDYFCTLFDSNYFSRGLAMYESLNAHSENFHLYIFAFDDPCYEALSLLNLANVTVIPLKMMEDPQLLSVKSERTTGEYAWTCTSSAILYVLTHYSVDLCTYLDADLFFYADPAILLAELGNDSILLTEHRYNPRYDQTVEFGRFCVQFTSFRNDQRGLQALRWWRDRCIEWCYARREDGKFGDQKYLDDWPTRFTGVKILENPGGGVAPWNIQLYDPVVSDKETSVRSRAGGEEITVVFFHFHNLKFFDGDLMDLGGYPISQSARQIFYWPYIRRLLEIRDQLGQTIGFDPSGVRPLLRDWKRPLRIVKRIALRNWNEMRLSVIDETQ